MFNKILFSNYYLRKRRNLKKDGKASSAYKYILDRVSKKFEMPSLAKLIREKSSSN